MGAYDNPFGYYVKKTPVGFKGIALRIDIGGYADSWATQEAFLQHWSDVSKEIDVWRDHHNVDSLHSIHLQYGEYTNEIIVLGFVRKSPKELEREKVKRNRERERRKAEKAKQEEREKKQLAKLIAKYGTTTQEE
jgi:hypothetical protein